jgi:hypothetical protein
MDFAMDPDMDPNAFAMPRELPLREVPDLSQHDEDFNELKQLVNAVVSCHSF